MTNMDDMTDMGDGVVFGFDEQERRRAYIASLRESNAAAHAALEAEIAQRAFSRPIESAMDKDRRELSEFYASLQEKREAKSKAADVNALATDVAASFEATARAIQGLLGENEVLRKDMASLREEIAALKAVKPAKPDSDIDRRLDRLDAAADKLTASVREFSSKRRFDSAPLPIPARLTN